MRVMYAGTRRFDHDGVRLTDATFDIVNEAQSVCTLRGFPVVSAHFTDTDVPAGLSLPWPRSGQPQDVDLAHGDTARFELYWTSFDARRCLQPTRFSSVRAALPFSTPSVRLVLPALAVCGLDVMYTTPIARSTDPP